MSTPALIYLALTLLGLGVVLAKHGQPRPDYNIGVTLVNTAISIGLLYWGGFFA